MSTARSPLWVPSVVAAGVAFVTGAVGGLLTDLTPWYYALEKPSWQPPDWLFGPVWSLIYVCTAIAAVIAWRRATGPVGRTSILAMFAVNLVFNVGWSFLFFRAQRPDHALIEVVGLWLSILALMIGLGRFSKVAGLLLIPYLAWVSFATFLNLTIVRLNFPFSGV